MYWKYLQGLGWDIRWGYPSCFNRTPSQEKQYGRYAAPRVVVCWLTLSLDVSAKDASQETAIGLLGLIIGFFITPLIDEDWKTWTCFVLFTFLHLFANYMAVTSVIMDKINVHPFPFDLLNSNFGFRYNELTYYSNIILTKGRCWIHSRYQEVKLYIIDQRNRCHIPSF